MKTAREIAHAAFANRCSKSPPHHPACDRQAAAIEAALAASQADFANACDVGRRLEASLATAQAELATLREERDRLYEQSATDLVQHGDLCGQIEELRGSLERARLLLSEFELSDEIDNSGDEEGTPAGEPWWMCLHCCCPMDECDLVGTCLGARARAFLATGTKETPNAG